MKLNSFKSVCRRPFSTGAGAALLTGPALLVSLLATTGCESDGFLDPTLVGRWERTPIRMPILEEIDLARKFETGSVPISPVRPADLQPDVQEYVIGAGDFINISVFELISVGVTEVQERVIDETGNIRLPVIGRVKAAGLSPSQLEEEIIDILRRKGVMEEATVSVVVQQSRQNLYSIIGAPEEGSTRFGTYLIPQPEFRLLEAIALAGGVNNGIKQLLIFRQTPLTGATAGETPGEPGGSRRTTPAPSTTDDLLDGILDPGAAAGSADNDRSSPPAGVESGLERTDASPRWVYVDNKFVKVEGSGGDENQDDVNLSNMIAQRVIEVPYDKLINGDMRYNVVVRPGDTIRVPNQSAGFVYVMGQSNRPGAYTVPGEKNLTLKQLIASSGGLSGLASPERTDLIRRTEGNQEVTLRINLAAIFHGTEPDIFLKPNDIVNIGSSGISTPLAVIRNGFRASYGFGFVLDRNFGTDVFGPISTDNN